jgi:RHS repeat-associated protein
MDNVCLRDLTTSAGITRQGYTFQTALGEAMGLNHMNGRVQDGITGQFLSPDPRIPDPTNTQSYNRYAYTNNNPLTLVDPTGFDAKDCPTDGGCGGLGSSVQGMPEQSSWSCYGDCGSGWANSITTTISAPGPSMATLISALLGGSQDSSSQGINNFENAFNDAFGDGTSQGNGSGDTSQGDQPQGRQIRAISRPRSHSDPKVMILRPPVGWIVRLVAQ